MGGGTYSKSLVCLQFCLFRMSYLQDKEMKELPTIKQFYTTVYAQVFSPCGKYLVADVVTQEHDVEYRFPIYSFVAHDGPIYALETNDKFLISAGTGSIQGWNWKDVLSKSAKVVWSLSIPEGTDIISRPETNAVLLNEKNGEAELYAGCGDNSVYCFDLETLKMKGRLSGHKDNVYCLAKTNNHQNNIWSGSEDGFVFSWDVRGHSQPARRVEPHKNELCSRPSHGKWIGCVAIDFTDDWLLCGGGPSLSLWHLRSMACTQIFPTPKSCATCAFFHEDLIVSGGTENCIYCWSFNGKEEAKIQTSASSLYSLLVQDGQQNEILCASGSSCNIDVCSKFKYKDFSLIFI